MLPATVRRRRIARSMGPLPIGGTALRAEVIPTDVRKGNGGRKVKIHGTCIKGFTNVLTVLRGVALISEKWRASAEI